MDANQLQKLAVVIISNMFTFALTWLIQDLRQANRKLKQVREDFAETQATISV